MVDEEGSSHRDELLVYRRHIKCLLPIAVLQVALIAVHVLINKYWPDWPYEWVAHAVVLALEAFYVIVPISRWRNEKYVISDRTVRAEWGLLYKQSREISLERIASISEERGILDRIFSTGTLNFYDAAALAQPKSGGVWNKGAKPEAGVRFNDVPHFKQVKELVEERRYKLHG